MLNQLRELAAAGRIGVNTIIVPGGVYIRADVAALGIKWFTLCTFRDCVFINCDFSGIRFSDCDFTDAVFVGCLIEDTTFCECEFDGTMFRGSSLLMTTFAQAGYKASRVGTTVFADCDLTDTEGLDAPLLVDKPVIDSCTVSPVIFSSSLFITKSDYLGYVKGEREVFTTECTYTVATDVSSVAEAQATRRLERTARFRRAPVSPQKSVTGGTVLLDKYQHSSVGYRPKETMSACSTAAILITSVEGLLDIP